MSCLVADVAHELRTPLSIMRGKDGYAAAARRSDRTRAAASAAG
nr:histidine kinase dimerization/phospho-acceptor domain-containing protein [Paenibacillus sp. AR247]